MRTKETTAVKKASLLNALEKSLGIVTQACRKVDIHRDTYYKWMKADPDFREAAKTIEGVVLDFAESALHKQINDGNVVATIFLLKTKGKCRGYVEKQEIEHSGEIGGSPQIGFADTTHHEE